MPLQTALNAGVPLLLVDIDGVLSLWGWPAEPRPAGVWTIVDGVPHFLAEEPAAQLRSLQPHFELAWCSGWEEKANEHLPALLGVGPLAFLRFDRSMAGAASRAHWKLAAIDAWAGPQRPLAWVDDAFNPACDAWAAERPGPTLLVATDPAEGLTAAHAGRLRAWAAELAAAGR